MAADLNAAAERRSPELLAPAGDRECLRAAVANGADAVYFGLETFNARRRAANFKLAELPEVVAYLHARNVRAYVTLNTLIFSDELCQAVEYAAAIARAGADSVIVQDLGLLHLIRRLVPSLPIHASTQMTQSEPEGVEFLREFGVSRVILARELTLGEIQRLAAETPTALEVFVHGAICVSYSGQCLASESLWGRSANRGLCGQACRLPYQLVVDGRLQDLGDRRYLLSPRDLAALDRIPELAASGVAGFKIEGRLKSSRYVAAATGAYRAAIDAALRRLPFDVTPEQEAELTLSFSRGLGAGFLGGVDHQQFVHGRFPKSRGICIGTVAGKTSRGIVVQINAEDRGACNTDTGAASEPVKRGLLLKQSPWPVKPGDGIVFDEGRPDEEEQGGRVYSVRPAPAGSCTHVELGFGRDDVNLAAVSVGSRVWKTDDPRVRRRLAATVRSQRPIHRTLLHARVLACAGEPLSLWLSDEDGNVGEAVSGSPLQPARKHSVTIELLREQLRRLGDTPFELASVELAGSDDPRQAQPVMVPKSILNQLRRRAVEELLRKRALRRRHEIVAPDVLDRIRAEIQRRFRQPIPTPQTDESSVCGSAAPSLPTLCILSRTLEQLRAVIDWARLAPPVSIGALYYEPTEVSQLPPAVALARENGRHVALVAPRIIMPGEETTLEQLVELCPPILLVRTLGELRFFRRRLPETVLVGDHSLNAANEVSAFVLAEAGLARLTPSHDLNWRQLKAMSSRISPALLEVVIHQHVPMFHTRHCLFAACLSGKTSCGGCDRPCDHHRLRLRDRLGVEHPVLTDCLGRNTVYQAAVQSAADLVPAMLDLGLRHFRIEFLEDSAEQVGAILDLYARLLNGGLQPSAALRQLREIAASPVSQGTFAFE